MLSVIPFPALPTPPSWFPGHMNRFTKQLPALLSRTDVVLELRDARLPLTSINHNLESESETPFLRPFPFKGTVSLRLNQKSVICSTILSRCYAQHRLVGWPHDDFEALGSEILFTEAAADCHILGWMSLMTNHFLARIDKEMESRTG
ncbi:hypothetical protein J3R83DRAFT_9796 [Lanmaoa asiatica]|nr:hypothetical protein J3R83DRAFT_9796 [Lanmaoa asiatica]